LPKNSGQFNLPLNEFPVRRCSGLLACCAALLRARLWRRFGLRWKEDFSHLVLNDHRQVFPDARLLEQVEATHCFNDLLEGDLIERLDQFEPAVGEFLLTAAYQCKGREGRSAAFCAAYAVG
jgi:hypothetical protein